MEGKLGSRSLSDRIVLLCLVDLEHTDSTPVHTAEVVRASRDLLETVERDPMDSLSEAAVNRALNRLDDDGLVEMSTPSGTSPTGKGRPKYALAVDTDDVVQALADDEEVAPIADYVKPD